MSASLTIAYRLTDRVTLTAAGVVSSPVGDVKDSPLVQEPTQSTGLLAATYRLLARRRRQHRRHR